MDRARIPCPPFASYEGGGELATHVETKIPEYIRYFILDRARIPVRLLHRTKVAENWRHMLKRKYRNISGIL